MPQTYHENMQEKIDAYVHLVFQLTRSFPKSELYVSTSQFKRAALSVALNYIEGYARVSSKANRNFMSISFASLKESEYLLVFCYKEKWILQNDFVQASLLCEEIKKMLWSLINTLPK